MSSTGKSEALSLANKLHARYLELESRRITIIEEQAAIKSELAAMFQQGRHETAYGAIDISPNRRFDAELAESVLADINPDLLQACMRPQIDRAMVKRVVSPDVYERCMKHAPQPRVTIQ